MHRPRMPPLPICATRLSLAPPWKEIYETDSERRQDFGEAERTYDRMVEVYGEYGYRTIELPKLTASARAKFILERIQLRDEAL
ncbi:MAG TPA: AAA family ATPase [Bryobacteraceae bacterium]|jgi:predicted ATPase|nr:AAA family ATPase [Bryobacteraceae bacterium]